MLLTLFYSPSQTEEEKKRLDELGESNLRGFQMDYQAPGEQQGPGSGYLYHFEGEDYRNKQQASGGGGGSNGMFRTPLDWIGPGKRERRTNVQYDVNQYYRDVLNKPSEPKVKVLYTAFFTSFQ